ncbi:MAG: ABC transporter substrate-binding protein [Chloroflexi bacterium]|nr:ABC transporter substrate-binding protein [Chloroflexota bacterium]
MNRVVLAIVGVVMMLVLAAGVLVVVVVVSGGDDGGGGSRAANELRLRGGEPITLDPHLTTDGTSALYVVEIFGGLLTLDLDLQIQPDLAEEIPTEANGGKVVNADGTVTYTFRLRENLLFHNRTPVRAQDVKYSLERAADPTTQSLGAAFFLADIVGVLEKLRGEADEVSGVQVIDDRTIEITIERDLPNFLFKLTYPTAFVVNQQQIEQDDNWSRRPIGTGPYKLKKWDFGDLITLEANEEYHLGAPQVKTVRYRLLGTSITLYEDDQIDVAGVGVDDLERVQDPLDPLNGEYSFGSQLSISYLGFNVNAPPFDDPLVREAFSMSINLEEIVSILFQDAIPAANSIVMPGLPAYSEDNQAPQFDPERALELLQQSSYWDTDALEGITVAEGGAGGSASSSLEVIIDNWRTHLGVEVTVEQSLAGEFFRNIEDGIYQMYILAWIMDYPAEENLLNLHFDSEGANNYNGYENPSVDTLLREALIEQDAERRIALYQQAEQLILDDVPWFPLFFDRFHILVKPYVKVYPIPGGIVPRLRFVVLEDEPVDE